MMCSCEASNLLKSPMLIAEVLLRFVILSVLYVTDLSLRTYLCLPYEYDLSLKYPLCYNPLVAIQWNAWILRQKLFLQKNREADYGNLYG